MRLLYSTTSPYARIARLAVVEKGLASTLAGELTDPWRDAPSLLEANPAARVPALVLDSGVPITESLLIVLWLETQHPVPSLLGPVPDRTIAQAGVAFGAIDAAAAIFITRRSAPGFDEMPVGLRRRRSIAGALARLEADPPALGDDDTAVASLAVIATVTLRDYIAFRFAGARWLPPTPRLEALSARAARRPNFAATVPREMPAG